MSSTAAETTKTITLVQSLSRSPSQRWASSMRMYSVKKRPKVYNAAYDEDEIAAP